MSSPEFVLITKPERLGSSLEDLKAALEQIRKNLAKCHLAEIVACPDLDLDPTEMFKAARDDLKEVVLKAPKVGKSVYLEVGRTVVSGFEFEKFPYDSEPTKPTNLEPESKQELTDNFTSFDLSVAEPVPIYLEAQDGVECFGNWIKFVPITNLAKTLAEGGQLTLVELAAQT